jgi:predicted nucleic acid-binding protein
MILVDTSVWIDHFRRGSSRLKILLDDGLVLCHPFVIGELASGNLNNRVEILSLLQALPKARVAEHSEVLHLVNAHQLYGRGLGWIDMHLLASTLLAECGLWTADKQLGDVAATLKISV